ncbi:hypothetical protein Dalk_1061 [Desulfatibacillum aliphaticivorans]|uniref:Uncharacterized protein n=1 Tax=Desulfatibacillum aliphaticivorans TaxID=218208 RepID=B8FK89_DESAL|nr:hypothetical protein Dalk_1061 [Desulfatibacillum aliphaticivorans]
MYNSLDERVWGARGICPGLAGLPLYLDLARAMNLSVKNNRCSLENPSIQIQED